MIKITLPSGPNGSLIITTPSATIESIEQKNTNKYLEFFKLLQESRHELLSHISNYIAQNRCPGGSINSTDIFEIIEETLVRRSKDD